MFLSKTYLESHGFEYVDIDVFTLTQENFHEVTHLVKKHNIDTLIVSPPFLSFLSEKFPDLNYIGPRGDAGLFETNKYYAKNIMKSLGVNVPEILEMSNTEDFDSADWPKPLVVKPAYVWTPAILVNDGQDHILAAEFKKMKLMDIFVEEYIYDKIEVNAFFVISNGQYFITHTQHISGEDINKNVVGREWFYDTFIVQLSPEQDKILRDEAHIILSELAKIPGHFEGSLCGFLTSTGKWYFGECNVRQDIHNALPTFTSGDKWFKGLTEDLDIIREAWRDKNQITKIIPTLKNPETRFTEPYPYHLHEKYDVTVPSSLCIKDEKYYAFSGGVVSVSDNRDQVDAFVEEMEATTNFVVNRPY